MNTPGPSNRLWAIFAVSSVVFVTVLAISPFKDFFREYRPIQQRYREELIARAGTRKDLERARATEIGIRQYWIPEWGGRVDRCTTCHLGIEDAGFTDAAQPLTTHPQVPHVPEDLDRFGCVSCHRGQGRATTMDSAHGTDPDWQNPLLPTRFTEASCGTCHRATSVPEAALLSRGRLVLQESGCYGCHELDAGRGWTSTAPDLQGLSQKTTISWVRAWLANPSEVVEGARMPRFELSSDEIDALTAFLWDQPLSGEQLDVSRTVPEGDYDSGGKIFRESMCISCHTVGGRGNGSAPELSLVASKVSREWLYAFLENPHRFQPDTEMPRYNFTNSNLADLTQYMVEEFLDYDAAPDETLDETPFVASKALIDEGEGLYKQYGCAGCHQIEGRDDRGKIGPSLDGIGMRPVELLDFGHRDDLPRTAHDWLAGKILDPGSFREELRMPRFDFSNDEIEALVTALLASTAESIPDDRLVPDTLADYSPPGAFGRLVDRYRCQSCHIIQRTGGDISTAPLTAEGSKANKEWLEEYLMVPTTIRPLLTERMVHLRMPREDASAMAEFMSNVYLDDEIDADLFAEGLPPERVARGRRLFHERYGCRACHMVDGEGGFFGPLIDGFGDRLIPGWTAWWLQGPQRWRGDVRCPDYGLDVVDAEDLAAYVSSAARGKEVQ